MIADIVERMAGEGREIADIIRAVRDAEDGPRRNLHQEFMAFWNAYPNRTGKGAAIAAYERARRSASAQDLLDGVMRYSQKRDDRPWCNPATWLNQQRWLDEEPQPLLGNSNLGSTFLSAAVEAKAKENGAVGIAHPSRGDVRRLSQR